MGLFAAIVRTTVNVALLPVAVVKDAATCAGMCTGQEKPYTAQQVEKIKDEADG